MRRRWFRRKPVPYVRVGDWRPAGWVYMDHLGPFDIDTITLRDGQVHIGYTIPLSVEFDSGQRVVSIHAADGTTIARRLVESWGTKTDAAVWTADVGFRFRGGFSDPALGAILVHHQLTGERTAIGHPICTCGEACDYGIAYHQVDAINETPR